MKIEIAEIDARGCMDGEGWVVRGQFGNITLQHINRLSGKPGVQFLFLHCGFSFQRIFLYHLFYVGLSNIMK